MEISSRILVSLLFLVLFSSFIEAKSKFLIENKPECNQKRQQKIDQQVFRLAVFGRNGRLFPTNQQELKTFCSETTQITDSIDKFILECMDGELLNIAKIFIYSTKRTLRTYCGKKTSRKTTKLLKYGSCLNQQVKQDQCMQQLLNQTTELIPYKIEKEKVKYLCCYNVEMRRCYEEKFRKQSCLDEDGAQIAMDLIRSLSNDMVNFGCGEYNEETDRCEKLPPLDRTKYVAKDRMNPKLTSALFVIIYLAESLEKFSLDIN